MSCKYTHKIWIPFLGRFFSSQGACFWRRFSLLWEGRLVGVDGVATHFFKLYIYRCGNKSFESVSTPYYIKVYKLPVNPDNPDKLFSLQLGKCSCKILFISSLRGNGFYGFLHSGVDRFVGVDGLSGIFITSIYTGVEKYNFYIFPHPYIGSLENRCQPVNPSRLGWIWGFWLSWNASAFYLKHKYV